jgi:hypothetical protein
MLHGHIVQDPSFSHDRIAENTEAPTRIETIPIELHHQDRTMGARGLRNHPTVCVNPVIANANYDQVGPDIDSHTSNEETMFPPMVQAGDVR